MNKTNIIYLAACLLSIIILACAFYVMKGAFLIGGHEGDTLHVMQILARMDAGQLPHKDFMTPIGILAFLPILLFVKAGFGIGMSFLLAQILLAFIMLPAVIYAAATRLFGWLGWLFSISAIVLILALVHGEAQGFTSASMYYNRWAWAMSFVVVVIGVLRPRQAHSNLADGLICGALLAVLVLIKVTYFVAFAPPVALGFLLRRQYKAFMAAIGAGLLMAVLVTLNLGLEFWQGYISDLLEVSRSETRPSPGRSLSESISNPAYLGGSVITLAAVVFLRQSGRMQEGMLLLLLAPGFFFVTWQNYGNDPQWLILLAILLLSWLPDENAAPGVFGLNLRAGTGVLSVAAISFITPSYVNLSMSHVQHWSQDVDRYTALVPNSGDFSDVMLVNKRALAVDAEITMDGPNSVFAGWNDAELRETGVEFQGEYLEGCLLKSGLTPWLDTIVTDLEGAGFSGGTRLFAADLFSSHWMYGEFEALEGGAPWYYGGLPGYDSANYLLVPLCPVSGAVRRQILELVTKRAEVLTELRRTSLYILFELGGVDS